MLVDCLLGTNNTHLIQVWNSTKAMCSFSYVKQDYCPFTLTLLPEVQCNSVISTTIWSVVCLYLAYGTYS